MTDGFVDLIEAGAITNRKKAVNPGKSVGTLAIGTRKLYDWMHDNPDLLMLATDYVNDPFVIAQHDNMISVNAALEVDLMGQVNAEAIGWRQYSGIGGQCDFVRGAGRSRGGKTFIAVSSTAAGGKISRIVAGFKPGTTVTTSRCDVQYIVTEYGVANLRGKTLRERAKLLIDIAHPDFRAKLEEDYAAMRRD